MRATETLHQQGQSLWLDNITRGMLDSGQIQKLIDQYSVTGLTCLDAPFTINTMPDSTLEAFFDHGEVGGPMPADGGAADELLSRFAEAGIDTDALAAQLQSNGAKGFVDAWTDLMERVDVQHASVT